MLIVRKGGLISGIGYASSIPKFEFPNWWNKSIWYQLSRIQISLLILSKSILRMCFVVSYLTIKRKWE